MRILGVIPARGGSKGLPGKNLMPIGGKSLVRRAIESARASTLLTVFAVSTDDEEIYNETERCRGSIIARPKELATDEAGMLPVLQHAVQAFGGLRPDLIVCLQPTSPFRTGRMIDLTIQAVLETGAGSAQTVTEAPYHPFFMSTLEREPGDTWPRIVALFPHDHIVRRQDALPAYMPTGAVYVTRYDVLMRLGRIRADDNRAVPCEFEESVNIDTIWDYRLAEMIAKERGW